MKRKAILVVSFNLIKKFISYLPLDSYSNNIVKNEDLIIMNTESSKNDNPEISISKSPENNNTSKTNEIFINSYSNDLKKTKGHAKILSFSHLRKDEPIKNEIIFKSTEIKEFIKTINSKDKNEQKVIPKKEKMDSNCFILEKCNIF